MNRSFVINRAKEFCKIGKHRFTLPRERVLSVLASGSAPMGAYKILTQLSQNEEKLKPPTVYRAINFWNTHGFIHRIESMNAYIICCRLHQHENFCVFICSSCHTAFELHMASLPPSIIGDLESKALTMTGSKTEVYGKCQQCNQNEIN